MVKDGGLKVVDGRAKQVGRHLHLVAVCSRYMFTWYSREESRQETEPPSPPTDPGGRE